MGFDFDSFGDESLSEAFVEWLTDDRSIEISRHFGRLWDYYHNPMHELIDVVGTGDKVNESSRSYVQAQEYGLPARITGMIYSGSGSVLSGRALGDIQRKEVVIENDIGWRINAMVDFLFGKGVGFVSKAPEVRRRREIEKIIETVFAANGAVGFFQDMAVLGSVYGFVDCVIRLGEEVVRKFQLANETGNMLEHISGSSDRLSSSTSSFESILQLASCIGLELIEAPRALPVLDENDYKKINYYIQHFYQQKNAVSGESSFLSRLFGGDSGDKARQTAAITEIIGPALWQKYEDRGVIAEGINPLGFVPVVHIQNIAQPYYYEGLSDVEQLIGLQDELNTRLSDRANRITFQSFKMYLAKGIEGFEDKPISPGRMWCTDNPDSSIEEFGGDGASPSEDIHIAEIREAMDKISGLTPVVAGVLKNKIGNLTSSVALKMTFMGMLAKTMRKQFSYGEGLKQICRMILEVLNGCGAYRTEYGEREFEIVFPNPLPEDEMDDLRKAQIKKDLGVSQERILEELGYER
jgi:hypothetical protein